MACVVGMHVFLYDGFGKEDHRTRNLLWLLVRYLMNSTGSTINHIPSRPLR